MPLVYDPYLAGRSVERVTGVAETATGEALPWTAIVKRTRGPGLRAARRELAVYRARIATADAAGLRAPTLFGSIDNGDEVELWLEEVHDEYRGSWPLERFGVAARHIGSWDASLAARSLPQGFDSEDAWAERHGQPERVGHAVAELDALTPSPAVESIGREMDDPGFARTRALIASTASRIEDLAALPQSLLHHDLVRSNLFAVSADATVAIDWENVGRGPLGVDLAPLVVGSVRRGEASSKHLRALESVVLNSYLEELRALRSADEDGIVRGYRLAVGLRWHVVLGTIRTALDPNSAGFRGSRLDEPRDVALAHLFALSRYILDVGLEPEAVRR